MKRSELLTLFEGTPGFTVVGVVFCFLMLTDLREIKEIRFLTGAIATVTAVAYFFKVPNATRKSNKIGLFVGGVVWLFYAYHNIIKTFL